MSSSLLKQTVMQLREMTDEDYDWLVHHAEGRCTVFQEIINRRIVKEEELHYALSKKLGYRLLAREMPCADIDVVRLFPRNVLEKYCVLPLEISNQELVLAVYDPFELYVLEEIRQTVGLALRICLCGRKYIREGISYYYSDIDARNAARIAGATADSGEAPAIKLVDAVLDHGYSVGASDIHIEPFGDETVIRLRVDGVMTDYAAAPGEIHSMIVARIKVMADLDIAEHRIPQDGNLVFLRDNEAVNLRVSVMPTVYGEKVVLRFLDFEAEIDNAGYYGMEEAAYKRLSRLLKAPNGMIYFTGPTGSGKSTTLYLILEELAKQPVNICTIEEPVERRIPRVNQTAVNDAGVNFGVGLRAILRQDPDIIMIGETRDPETAEIAVRAAMTGHLVLSTLHTTDAVASVDRLTDMGIAPYLVSGSLIGAVAQRLLRKVCTACAEECFPTSEESEIIGREIRFIRRGKGCHLCNYTGYKGRIAIHELFEVDSTVKEMIAQRKSTGELRRYACSVQGMKTLRQSAVELVAKGLTTPEEVLRAVFFSE